MGFEDRLKRIVSGARKETAPAQAPQAEQGLSDTDLAKLEADLSALRAEHAELIKQVADSRDVVGGSTPTPDRIRITELEQEIAFKESVLNKAKPFKEAA